MMTGFFHLFGDDSKPQLVVIIAPRRCFGHAERIGWSHDLAMVPPPTCGDVVGHSLLKKNTWILGDIVINCHPCFEPSNWSTKQLGWFSGTPLQLEIESAVCPETSKKRSNRSSIFIWGVRYVSGMPICRLIVCTACRGIKLKDLTRSATNPQAIVPVAKCSST